MNQLAIQSRDGAIRVALLENGRLEEYYEETEDDLQTVGSIYLGKVMNVLPGMQAAFIDIGLKKNAFLYIDDLLPAHLEKQPKVKPSIMELVSAGQTVLVQVTKEAAGTKGARVTTHFAIPGRWGVYMPEADYIGVSRKIEAEAERDRLKQLVSGMLIQEEGFIVRTIAVEASEQSIRDDLQYLRNVWSAISRQTEQLKQSGEGVPSQVYGEQGLMYRLARDVISSRLDEIVIDDRRAMQALAAIVESMCPTLLSSIKLNQGGNPLFRELGIDQQLDKALARKVWLDNGSYLMVDVTEALTVIDVNTGKYIGQTDLEQTVFEVNMAAAAEIARLLRLRDMGGIVIIDFIDMTIEANRRAVLESLEHHCRRDRTKTTVVGWTKLGLVELTRKKVRTSRQTRSGS